MFSNWCRSCRFIYMFPFPGYSFWFDSIHLIRISSLHFDVNFDALSHGVFKQFHHLKWWHLQLSYLNADELNMLALLHSTVVIQHSFNILSLSLCRNTATLFFKEKSEHIHINESCTDAIGAGDIFYFYWQNDTLVHRNVVVEHGHFLILSNRNSGCHNESSNELQFLEMLPMTNTKKCHIENKNSTK